MLQFLLTTLCIALAVLSALGVLSKQYNDSLLERIGLILVFFACAGALHRTWQDLPYTERQAYTFIYGLAMVAIALLIKRRTKNAVNRKSRPQH